MIWYLILGLWLVPRLLRARSRPQDQTMPDDILVESFALAIAKAEGFFVSGSLPERRNNPGSITDSTGALRTYPTVEDGWNALRRQVRLMISGESRYYSPDMTIAELAVIYTGGDNPESWAATVAESLGVSTSRRLRELGVIYA